MTLHRHSCAGALLVAAAEPRAEQDVRRPRGGVRADPEDAHARVVLGVALMAAGQARRGGAHLGRRSGSSPRASRCG